MSTRGEVVVAELVGRHGRRRYFPGRVQHRYHLQLIGKGGSPGAVFRLRYGLFCRGSLAELVLIHRFDVEGEGIELIGFLGVAVHELDCVLAESGMPVGEQDLAEKLRLAGEIL